MTGMRFNEMTALDIERDIDLENQLIHINHNYDPRNDVFTSPKTGDARTIYINSDAVNVIKQLLSIRLTKIMRYNLNRDNTLLFRQNRGERPKNIRTVNVLLKKHSINGKEISTHIFRHTFITYMIEDGVDINLIAKHVGHSSVKMIQEVYSHFTDKMDENLKNVILKFKIG